MLNDNAKKWIAALRSEEYNQGKNNLTYVDSDSKEFDCCLGVACKLYAKENFLQIEKEGVLTLYKGQAHILPSEVRDWLGLNFSAGNYDTGSLTNLNDAGTPFSAIANIIESEPKGLFRE